MAREKLAKVKIDGKTYYTSRYFVDQIEVSFKTARRFLKDFPVVKGSTNPRLYTWRTMQHACAMYLHDHPSLQLEDVKEGVHTETIVGQKRYESEIVNIDQKRANTEDAFNDEVALKYLNDGMPNPSKHEQMIKDIVRSREKEEFSKMTLKLLLAINGYSFDFDQYEKDLYTDIKAEENRPTDASRSSKHLIARERLDNPTEYLSTIVKPK